MDPSGRAFVGGGNNGIGRLAIATRGAGRAPYSHDSTPVIGMTGFSTADGGVRMRPWPAMGSASRGMASGGRGSSVRPCRWLRAVRTRARSFA